MAVNSHRSSAFHSLPHNHYFNTQTDSQGVSTQCNRHMLRTFMLESMELFLFAVTPGSVRSFTSKTLSTKKLLHKMQCQSTEMIPWSFQILLVSWCLTSLSSTNMAISDVHSVSWRQFTKLSQLLSMYMAVSVKCCKHRIIFSAANDLHWLQWNGRSLCSRN